MRKRQDKDPEDEELNGNYSAWIYLVFAYILLYLILKMAKVSNYYLSMCTSNPILSLSFLNSWLCMMS